MNISQPIARPRPAHVGRQKTHDSVPAYLSAEAQRELRDILLRVQRAASRYRVDQRLPGLDGKRRPIGHLIGAGHLEPLAGNALMRLLGEGPAKVVRARRPDLVHETALRGIWRIDARSAGRAGEYLEVGAIPSFVLYRPSAHARPEWGEEGAGEGLARLRAELSAALDHRVGETALPLASFQLSVGDQQALRDALGDGGLELRVTGTDGRLSRIFATGVEWVWRIEQVDAAGRVEESSITIAEVPRLACASQSELAESAARLESMLQQF